VNAKRTRPSSPEARYARRSSRLRTRGGVFGAAALGMAAAAPDAREDQARVSDDGLGFALGACRSIEAGAGFPGDRRAYGGLGAFEAPSSLVTSEVHQFGRGTKSTGFSDRIRGTPRRSTTAVAAAVQRYHGRSQDEGCDVPPAKRWYFVGTGSVGSAGAAGERSVGWGSFGLYVADCSPPNPDDRSKTAGAR
jgi:hypothetical protein